MLSAIIVDDERENIKHLTDLIELVDSDINILGAADSLDSAVALIIEKKPQVVFLDIKMPGGTSFEIIERTADLDYEVIFVTAFDKYAIRAVKFSALDYLLKPVDPEELAIAIKKCRTRVTEKIDQKIRTKFLRENMITYGPNQQIAFPTFEGLCFVKVSEIIKFVADGSYTEAHFTGGRKLLISKNLKEIEKLMDGKGFNRVHKSYMINLGHISEYKKGSGGVIRMSDGTSVYVSKRKRESFLSIFKPQFEMAV